MNTYIAFYKSNKLEVSADTALEARDKAARIFKARKAYDVSVVLVEKDGQPITHKTSEL